MPNLNFWLLEKMGNAGHNRSMVSQGNDVLTGE